MMETKTVQARVVDVKAADGRGTATALVSVFGNVDHGGDRVMPGAFAKTLEAWRAKGDPIPVVWSHDWGNPESFVGEADPADIKETPEGLVVPMTFDMDRPRGEQVHHLLKSRRVTQFSFGYFASDYKMTEDPEYGQVRELTQIDLFEVGPTLLGMNPSTQLLEAASALRGKTGRVLSGKNETLIREAANALGQVLATLDEGKSSSVGAKAWTCAADPDLPIDDGAPWDGAAARARIFTWAGFDGDNPDPEMARRAFLVYDDAAPELRGSYKLAFADIVNGELTAIGQGLRTAASRLPQTDASAEALDAGRAILDRYFLRLNAASATPADSKAVDVPGWISDNAALGLSYYADGFGGDGLVDATIAEARDMSAGIISDDKVRRMGPWIARHLGDLDAPQNSDPEDPAYPGPGLVAMLLWGGGPDRDGALRAQAWAEDEAAGLDMEDSAKTGQKTPDGASGDGACTIDQERLFELLTATRYREE